MRSSIARFALAALLAAFVAAETHAQRPAHVAVVDSGLVRGDARQVLTSAAASIEMALLGQSREYSLAQAQPRLMQFFRQYPPQAFAWTTEEVGDADWYATGRYHVRPAGTPLRVYAHWQKIRGRWELATVHVFR